MNILEAYALLKKGKAIKMNTDGCIRYVIQANLFPFNEKTLYVINPAEDVDRYPASLEDVTRDVLDSVCLEALTFNNYEETTIEIVLKELQDYYKEDRKGSRNNGSR